MVTRKEIEKFCKGCIHQHDCPSRIQNLGFILFMKVADQQFQPDLDISVSCGNYCYDETTEVTLDDVRPFYDWGSRRR